jgi:hypothetical protein
MAAVHTMLNLPYHDFTHPEFGTVMRMLNTSVPFDIRAVERRALAAEMSPVV